MKKEKKKEILDLKKKILLSKGFLLFVKTVCMHVAVSYQLLYLSKKQWVYAFILEVVSSYMLSGVPHPERFCSPVSERATH